MKSRNGVFIVWRNFQRRVEVLAPFLDLEIHYFHYSWEERSKILKAFSYLLKSIGTLRCLIQKKPAFILVQFPPTPALYCVALYSWLAGTRYIADCHIWSANSQWLKWWRVRKLLKGKMIVHNRHVIDHVIGSMNLQPLILRDGIAKCQSAGTGTNTLLTKLGLTPQNYVLFPCSFSSDEPIDDLLDAARQLPEVRIVATWFSERLSTKTRRSLPANVLLTGYLPTADFNHLFANAGAALVLTKQEDVQLSGMQEAMAFDVPAIVTDLKTTRYLYKDYPVYVKNDPESIIEGIRYALQNRQILERRMRDLRAESEKEFLNQLAQLEVVIKGSS